MSLCPATSRIPNSIYRFDILSYSHTFRAAPLCGSLFQAGRKWVSDIRASSSKRSSSSCAVKQRIVPITTNLQGNYNLWVLETSLLVDKGLLCSSSRRSVLLRQPFRKARPEASDCLSTSPESTLASYLRPTRISNTDTSFRPAYSST